MDIGALLAELLDEAGDVALSPDGEYARSGVAFAAAPPAGGVDVRLGDEIAEAARRTPDTYASDRGAGWVHFSPREWDTHARDRLAGWFRVAWRAAVKP